MEKIKVIVKRPDEEYGHMTWISNTLKNLQRTVEGFIETVNLDDNGLVMICNEDGKFNESDANFKITSPIIDVIFGTVIICGTSEDEFANVPIDLQTWKNMLGAWGNEI